MDSLSEISGGKIALAEEGADSPLYPLELALKGGFSPKKMVIISAKRQAAEVSRVLQGIAGTPKGGVFIIDCVGKKSAGEKQVAYVKSPKNITNISIALSSAFSLGEKAEGHVLVYLDGLEEFSKKLPKAKFDSFIYELLMKIRLENAAGIIVLGKKDGKGISKGALEAIEYLCDGSFLKGVDFGK